MDELRTRIAEFIVAETEEYDGYISIARSTADCVIIRYESPNVLISLMPNQIKMSYWAPYSGVEPKITLYDYADPHTIQKIAADLCHYYHTDDKTSSFYRPVS